MGIKGPDLWFEGPDLGSERPGLRLGGIQLKPDLTDPLQLNPVITNVKGPTKSMMAVTLKRMKLEDDST